jgi:hypothetical protein
MKKICRFERCEEVTEMIKKLAGKLRTAGAMLENVPGVQTYEDYAKFLIDEGVTVQEWISVKYRLPTREDANETESILAINKDEKYVGRWVWDIVARWPTEFTYWMPMPQPPKGE